MTYSDYTSEWYRCWLHISGRLVLSRFSTCKFMKAPDTISACLRSTAYVVSPCFHAGPQRGTISLWRSWTIWRQIAQLLIIHYNFDGNWLVTNGMCKSDVFFKRFKLLETLIVHWMYWSVSPESGNIWTSNNVHHISYEKPYEDAVINIVQ